MHLGIDYEGVEHGATNMALSPTKNRIAQSIEVGKQGRISMEVNGGNPQRGSVIVDGAKPSTVYKPKVPQNSGGILARHTSIEKADGAVRTGVSALSMHQPEPMVPQTHHNSMAAQANSPLNGDLISSSHSIPVMSSQTKQPSRVSLLKRAHDVEDEPWAEVAKFNQLLDLKIKLDEETSQGVYSNLVMVQHGESEFILDFMFLQPGRGEARVGSRVILNPRQAKRLMGALGDNVTRYERRFGPIPVPATGPGSGEPVH